MPRHDRAHGQYHCTKQKGAKRVHIGSGRGRSVAEIIFGRQGGNTPKPNAPKPQGPKPGPRPGR